ncbi:protein-L-isoaspartate(D-aspartate) O-methyltransferase [Sulfurovum riftiae]|nr:protein-L-isoaspartate(D-aspartate) O-methyltransferase [Sulfurovum riftiae]
MQTKILFFLLFVSVFLLGGEEGQYVQARKGMVETIEREVGSTSGYLGRERLKQSVIDAMGKVPRHRFVPQKRRKYAYENRPLPIGHGQTISQPYIVAVMTDLLDINASSRVLEVGTGSGYQAAILAEIAKEVYTIEVIKELAATAEKTLRTLGYKNIRTRIGDGYYGWEAYAPYDAIIVTAASGSIPPPLLKQLKPGGRMIIPVGGFSRVQHLILVRKDLNGSITTRQILPVRFVPLTGKH